MAKVIDRLGSSFDSSKFGEDINLSDKAKNYLNTAPLSIPEWMKSDIANNSVSRTDYFRNPVSFQVSEITSNVSSIISICTDDPDTNFILAVPAAKDLANTANTLKDELVTFLSHTNRLSGVSNFADDPTKPHYTTAMALGGIALTITSSTDSVNDASPILNNFTSLYIGDELSSNSWNIGNSTVFLTEVDRTTVTTLQLNEIRDKINSAYLLVSTRRAYDESHFNRTQELIEDFQFLNALNNSGSTERNVINSLVGTAKLKNIVGS